MTKQEAIQAMQEGKKVAHIYYEPGEWNTMNQEGRVVFEDGNVIHSTIFWRDRSHDCFLTDWFIVN